ncbi:hypothetical protein ATC1_131294 [Flexilinea flocculi]|jgi:predicted PurR-regulated permease PerM|uniref:Uncharacterized protein n=1 Tax=Flexilinea flocculi TaxID=1678840 RepID=A0A0S7BM11_9CHLR|nr:hypothetical protein ATC1_131294 [Flexilinea flocculi]
MENQKLPSKPIKSTGKSGKKFTIFIFLLLIAAGIVYFLTISSVQTITKIRDLSIILFVFESIIICFFLIILIIQFSILINLIQNEIKPILKTTKETVNHIKGTVEFLGDNMVEPVIQTNSKIAGFTKIISSLKSGIINKKGR